MCYNARMKEGYGHRGTKVAPCCAESHINITRLVQPTPGQAGGPRQTWLAGAASVHRVVGAAESFEAGFLKVVWGPGCTQANVPHTRSVKHHWVSAMAPLPPC